MFVYQLVNVLSSLLTFYEWLVVIWCLLSWFPIPTSGIIADFAQVLDNLVSPFINLFRRFIPPFMGVDFSPIVAFFALELLAKIVFQLLYAIA